jgi:hypothetical protein
MRDASTFVPYRTGRALLRAGCVVLLLAAAGALCGCASGGAPGTSFAMASDGPTVAFESIDGPPPAVFERMVGMLDSETKLRNLSVVSREGSAAYRVRSYLSAQVIRGRTVIAWVWDVYDRDQQRALRLSGQEVGGKTGRDAVRNPWGAADDLVLRKIAQAGLSGLTGMINGTPEAPASPAGRRGPAVASADEPAAPSRSFAALGYTGH